MSPSRFPAAVVLFAFALSTAACATTQQPATLSGERIQAAVDSAHARWQDDTSGKNADYIPYLAHVPSELFGVVVVTADGRVYAHGDVDYGFSIQSVSKPFTAALVMQESGHEAVVEKIGVEPTGLPFNSIVAIEQLPARSVNPMVNAGAIAAVSLVIAESAEQRWHKIRGWYNRFAGEELEFNQLVYESLSSYAGSQPPADGPLRAARWTRTANAARVTAVIGSTNQSIMAA